MPSIKDVFAGNLRHALRAPGAVARLEARSGVGRVQLYRYLNGTIPNEVNLGRICAALGVEESSLFQTSRSGVRGESVISPNELQSLPWNVERSHALKIYYEVPDAPDYVIVAVVNVFAFEAEELFVRYTGFSVGGECRVDESSHIHTGAVWNSGSYTFFQGRRSNAQPEPSLLYLSGVHAGRDVFEGGALVLTHQGPSFLRLVARKLENPLTETDIVRSVGAFTESDCRLEASLVRLLKRELPVHVGFG